LRNKKAAWGRSSGFFHENLKVEYAVFMKVFKTFWLEKRIKPALCESTSAAAASLHQPQAASTLSAELRTA
jgi:hypothetical protein